ncbi:hypothetical protein LZ30DRAFT_728439 [Colletotrichum cereale]|nr:hypothetical protein LZ30DRAFT_728439 [Colletotrichum cereale]
MASGSLGILWTVTLTTLTVLMTPTDSVTFHLASPHASANSSIILHTTAVGPEQWKSSEPKELWPDVPNNEQL